jgi:CRP-like cAMP-binding protein
MYIVLDGKVQIFQGEAENRFVQAQFGRGNFFGEMAVVSGQPRVATAVAASPTVLLPVGKEALLEKISTDPAVALHTIQILIVRLRRSLNMLT